MIKINNIIILQKTSGLLPMASFSLRRERGESRMDIAYQMEGETLVVPMPREVDHHAAKAMSREIDFLIDSWHVRRLVFDFSGTEFMDSSVIGVMIGRSRTMEMYRGEIYAVHLGERARTIFHKSGLNHLIRTDLVENNGR